jgi:hypothetical protein
MERENAAEEKLGDVDVGAWNPEDAGRHVPVTNRHEDGEADLRVELREIVLGDIA